MQSLFTLLWEGEEELWGKESGKGENEGCRKPLSN